MRKQMTASAGALIDLCLEAAGAYRKGCDVVIAAGTLHKSVLSECLSRMKGNFHVRFWGGLAAVTSPGYPVQYWVNKFYSWNQEEVNSMTAVEAIEQEIKKLSPNELAELRLWFAKFDADSWDAQIESDAAAGKLDALAAEALAEYEAGKAREIWSTTHQPNFGNVSMLCHRKFRNSLITITHC
jgi:hypothetical protein